jgi:hypothetical protein
MENNGNELTPAGNPTPPAALTPELDFRIKLQNFCTILAKQPEANELQKTPDGKAMYLPIDFIETTLDELYYGLWETKEFRWQAIANEITASITLRVFHPTAQVWIERVGSASIAIMVDKAPDGLVGQERNRWALDVGNKKPNALDMGLPKLKTDCIKNAALSLGNKFGRNINRKHNDTYKPLTKWTQPQ